MAIYFAATPLSEWITAAGLPVWLAAGVGLAVLAVLGSGYWPVVLAAGWLSAIAMGYPPYMAASLAVAGLMEALAGVSILRLGDRRSWNRVISALWVLLVVPAIGATFTGSLNGTAWKSWWMRDAAGLLLLAPLWTRRPREIAGKPQVNGGVAESLLNLSQALMAFESAAPVVITKKQEIPVHRLR